MCNCLLGKDNKSKFNDEEIAAEMRDQAIHYLTETFKDLFTTQHICLKKKKLVQLPVSKLQDGDSK